MTSLEAGAILLCFAIAAAVGVWLIVSGVFGRRRIPERLEPVSMAQMAAKQAQLNRLAEKRRRLREEVVDPLEEQTALMAARIANFGPFYAGVGNHVEFYFPGSSVPMNPGTLGMFNGELLPQYLSPREEARQRMIGVLDAPAPDFAASIDHLREQLPPWRPIFDHSPPRPWAHG